MSYKARTEVFFFFNQNKETDIWRESNYMLQCR